MSVKADRAKRLYGQIVRTCDLCGVHGPHRLEETYRRPTLVERLLRRRPDARRYAVCLNCGAKLKYAPGSRSGRKAG